MLLDTLDWEHTLSTSVVAGKIFKKTLSDYSVHLEDDYLINMAKLKPPRSFDLQNKNHVYKNCY